MVDEAASLLQFVLSSLHFVLPSLHSVLPSMSSLFLNLYFSFQFASLFSLILQLLC